MDQVQGLELSCSVTGRTCQRVLAAGQVLSVEVEAERLAAALMRRHPGSLVWFGGRTRQWWALARLRGAWTLLDRQTIDEVAHILNGAGPAIEPFHADG